MSIRLDDLQNGYLIRQETNHFCFGSDAVLLAHFAELRKGDTVLDLGTGNGILPLLLLPEAPEGVTFTGLELQEAAAALAGENAALNHAEDRFRVICGDIRRIEDYVPAQSFTVVITNPPYRKAGGGLINPTDAKAIARHELACSLTDLARAASYALKSSGRLYMIHLSERLADVIRTLSEFHLEVKELHFIREAADKPSKLMLVEAVKGGRPGLKVT